MPTADYRLLIDWDNSGSFDGGRIARFLGSSQLQNAEDVTPDLRLKPQLVIGRGRDVAREYLPPLAGQMGFSLDNPEGKYSYNNASSPLYGYVVPGRTVDLQALYGGTWYPLFRGFLDTPTEQPYQTDQKVHFDSLDGLAKLKAAKVSTAMYTSIRTDQAIGYILDAAGWPAGARSLDTGATTLARWWVDDVDAFTAIRDLVFTEGPGAVFYVDASGNVVFESRHYRLLTSRCTSSQATFRGSGAEPVYGTDFQYEPGLKGIVNSCTVPVRSYTIAALGTIWAGPTPLTIAPNDSYPLTVSTTTDGFTGAVDPTEGAGDFTVTAGSVTSATLSRSSGRRATLTIVAGPNGATLTGLRVRAQAVTISEQLVNHSINASASQTAYGARTFPTEFIPKWIPSVNDAVDYCNAVVGRYKDPRPQVRIGVSNGDEDRLAQALTRKISDRITVIESARAFVNDDFTIEAITHEISDGRNHVTRFSCEKAISSTYWALGVAGLSELGSTTTLGFALAGLLFVAHLLASATLMFSRTAQL